MGGRDAALFGALAHPLAALFGALADPLAADLLADLFGAGALDHPLAACAHPLAACSLFSLSRIPNNQAPDDTAALQTLHESRKFQEIS